MVIHDWLVTQAARTPDALLCVDAKRSLTYADVELRSRRIAAALAGSGVKRGDRVVLAIENSGDWIASYFGILRAGCVAVPLAHGARSDRMRFALQDCTPAACILDGATAAAARAVLSPSSVRALFVQGGGAEAYDLDTVLENGPEDEVSVRLIDLDLAAIIYTSGSTGAPRGVMLSHRNIRANTESIVTYLELTPHDRVMVVLPFYYVYGLSLLHTHVFAGGSLVIDNRFAFPNVVLKGMQEHEVTGFAGVPSTFALLLHRSALASMHFPSLRYVTQAGGPMPPALLREWRRIMPDVPFYVMYGATEASARLSFLHPSEIDLRGGSIGRAIPNVELLVIKEDGQPAAPGEVGEIVARGSNISAGYWNDPEETEKAFGPMGYRTGDLATMDADGYLYLVGRRHHMLKVGAHRVSAKEIEDMLHEHAGVHEAAVIGAPHELLGEVPVAFVAARDGGALDPAEVLGFCRRHLPDHKVPTRVVVCAELPKSGAGKIDKAALKTSPPPLAAMTE